MLEVTSRREPVLVNGLSFRGIPCYLAVGIRPAAHPKCRLVADPSGYVAANYITDLAHRIAAKNGIMRPMGKNSSTQKIGTGELLARILDEVQACSGYLKTTAESTAKTATHAKNVRKDIRSIRDGKTGPSPLRGIDPLPRPRREEVNRVKEIIREKRKMNPAYSLLSVSKQVRKESARIGRVGGYTTDLALNSRASTELKREEAGLPPF